MRPALLVAVLFRILDNLRMFDLPYVLVGPGKPSVETISILAFLENNATRFEPAAAYAVLLFLYVVLVAYAFVKLLGADVIGEAEKDPQAAKGQRGLRPIARGTHHEQDCQRPSASTSPSHARRAGAKPPARTSRVAQVAALRGHRSYPRLLPRAVLLDGRQQPAAASDVFETTLPQPPSLQNYKDAFAPANHFGRALFNSVFVAGTVTVLVLIIAILSAYALARLKFRGKNLALSFIIATSMFPGIAMVIPLFSLFTDIGWINSYQALILPAMSFALPLAVWILVAFFRQMPAELEQAAMIDGCTQGQAFRKVILPLAAPGVFTTAIIVFVAAWNEYIIALTMTNKFEYRTATVAVTFFTGATGRDIPFGSIMAAGVILTVPLLIMVLIFQRRIVAGLTAGGVKS